jgi:hypothetical protein
MSDKFDHLMQEIEEDIRYEKIEKIWRNHGRQLIYLCFGIIGIAVVYNFWQHHQESKNRETSKFFIEGQKFLNSDKKDEGIALMEKISKEGPKNYQILAKFNTANVLAKSSKVEDQNKALDLYKQISESSSEKFFKDFAKFLHLKLRLNLIQNKSSTETFDNLLNDIKPLISDNCEVKYLALELDGLIKFLSGNKKDALEVFANLLKEKNVTNEMKMRIQLIMQSVLSVM